MKNPENFLEKFNDYYKGTYECYETKDILNKIEQIKTDAFQAGQDSMKEKILSKLIEEKNKPHTKPITSLIGWNIGFNNAISEVKDIIKHL